MTRQVVLDTETTGLEPAEGHRIIEIGCVELVNRRLSGNNFQQYINPDREIDAGAVEVHGITNASLADQPRFEAVAPELLGYLAGAELIIHNAPFDLGFLNHEFGRLGADWAGLETHCRITDTLTMARKLHPGQRNSLDALCKRYGIDNHHRDLHGALLDSEILADVYLMMTGGQGSLSLDNAASGSEGGTVMAVKRVNGDRKALAVVQAAGDDLTAHAKILQRMRDAGACAWGADAD